MIGQPLKVLAFRTPEVSPQSNPVSWMLNWQTRSLRLSPLTSESEELTAVASAPVLPNFTVAGSTVLASKVGVERIATGSFPGASRKIGFGDPPGLISIGTVTL